jgi:hypothetical protein
VAIDDSASMACARVMRGTNSIEKVVSPCSSAGTNSPGSSSGRRKLSTTAPFLSRLKSSAEGLLIPTRTSADPSNSFRSATTVAPASR